jgi:hypothetical protein
VLIVLRLGAAHASKPLAGEVGLVGDGGAGAGRHALRSAAAATAIATSPARDFDVLRRRFTTRS